jgi:hypothetical protein
MDWKSGLVLQENFVLLADNDPARIYVFLATIWEQPVARFFDPEAPASQGTLVLIAFHEFRSRGKHYRGEEGRH